MLQPGQEMLPERVLEEPEPVLETSAIEPLEGVEGGQAIRTIWVDSWRDIPVKNVDSGVKAYYDSDADTIYAIRNVTTDADIKHEEYHALRGTGGMPQNPAAYIRDELSAHKYAYDSIQRPDHILGRLRAMFNDLRDVYSLEPHKAMDVMRSEFSQDGFPESWRGDFSTLKNEFDQLYGRLPSYAMVSGKDMMLPEEYRMVGTGNRLLRSAVALERSSDADDERDRRKKRYREKNWWEDETMYGNQTPKMADVGKRYYRGHQILPPDLGGVI